MTTEDMNGWPREVLPPPVRATTPVLGVFTGIFGRRWLENALDNLTRQEGEPTLAVLAVNGTDDIAVERLLAYQAESQHEIWVVVNQRNMGPLGSWYRNRDLMTTPWTALMHQDDVYLGSHLDLLRRMADQAEESTLGLFTTLGGISEDGRHEMSPPAMVNRHLRRQPSAVLLPALVARHAFPTPAWAVRTSIDIPDLAWYDSGASDSEWHARLACMGTLDATDEVTVQYRQPVDSESSTTSYHTRAWLWALSLSRLVASAEFRHLVTSLENGGRSAFAVDLLAAIPARYPDSPLFEYVQFQAAQQMAACWDYRESETLRFLRSRMAALGPSAGTGTLDSLMGDGAGPQPGRAPLELLGRERRRPWWDRQGRKLYRRHAHRLPRSWRERVFGWYSAFRTGAS